MPSIGAQFGVAEVELRGVAVGDGTGQAGSCLLLLRVDHVELALRRLQCRAHPGVGSERLRMIGIRLLVTLLRAELVAGKIAIAVPAPLR